MAISENNGVSYIPLTAEEYPTNRYFIPNYRTYGVRPVFIIDENVRLRSDIGDGKTPETAYEFDI